MLFAQVSIMHILFAGCRRMRRKKLPDANGKSGSKWEGTEKILMALGDHERYPQNIRKNRSLHRTFALMR